MAVCRFCGESYSIKYHAEYFAHHREDYNNKTLPPPCVETLRARLDRAVAENEAWRSGAIYLIHVETDDGFVDKFAHKDRGYWEPYDTVDEAVDAPCWQRRSDGYY